MDAYGEILQGFEQHGAQEQGSITIRALRLQTGLYSETLFGPPDDVVQSVRGFKRCSTQSSQRSGMLCVARRSLSLTVAPGNGTRVRGFWSSRRRNTKTLFYALHVLTTYYFSTYPSERSAMLCVARRALLQAMGLARAGRAELGMAEKFRLRVGPPFSLVPPAATQGIPVGDASRKEHPLDTTLRKIS